MSYPAFVAKWLTSFAFLGKSVSKNPKQRKGGVRERMLWLKGNTQSGHDNFATAPDTICHIGSVRRYLSEPPLTQVFSNTTVM
jgi:hypothetical protein